MTDTVTVSLGFKYNMGYNNATAFYSWTSEVRDGENEDDAKARVEATVQKWTDAKFDEIDSANKAK